MFCFSEMRKSVLLERTDVNDKPHGWFDMIDKILPKQTLVISLVCFGRILSKPESGLSLGAY